MSLSILFLTWLREYSKRLFLLFLYLPEAERPMGLYLSILRFLRFAPLGMRLTSCPYKAQNMKPKTLTSECPFLSRTALTAIVNAVPSLGSNARTLG